MKNPLSEISQVYTLMEQPKEKSNLKDEDPIGVYFKKNKEMWEKRLKDLQVMGPIFSRIHDHNPHN